MTDHIGTGLGTGHSDGAPAVSAKEFQGLVEMIGAEMPEVLVDLLDTYIEESAGLVNSLVEAQARGDVPSMLRPAHSLKSSSASIGAMQLSRLCAALESHVRDASPGVEPAALVDAIDHEFGRVKVELAVERAKFAAQQ
jgi:HPt (histidine-containing phosphotransfer) domain-containing protein